MNKETVDNHLVDKFIKNLMIPERKFSYLNDDDKELLNEIHEKYDSICRLESGQDVYSLHLIAILDSFIYDSISRNKSNNSNMIIDEDITSLSGNYYNDLSEYFESLNKKNNTIKTLDNVKWIKSVLSYIDKECNMLKMASDFSFNQSLKSIESAKSSLIKQVDETKNELSKATIEANNATVTATKAAKVSEENTSTLTNVRKQVKTATDTANSIIPHMLTSLGIFVSIIIAVVSIYLNDLISINGDGIVNRSLNQLDFARYLLSGQVIINIIFLMLYIVSRLTNKNILTRCSYYNPIEIFKNKSFRPCSNCSECTNCKFYNRMWRKAGYMVSINLIFVAGYFFVYLWWVVETYILSNINIFFEKSINDMNIKSFIFGLVWLSVIFIFLIILIKKIILLFDITEKNEVNKIKKKNKNDRKILKEKIKNKKKTNKLNDKLIKLNKKSR